MLAITRFGRLVAASRKACVASHSRCMIRTIMTEPSSERLEALFPRPRRSYDHSPRWVDEETERALVHGLKKYHVERDPFTNERGFHSFVDVSSYQLVRCSLFLQPAMHRTIFWRCTQWERRL